MLYITKLYILAVEVTKDCKLSFDVKAKPPDLDIFETASIG